ncbi:MAG TPA: hypothetical protein VN420_03175 [Candidatus Fimivivens sp.]|nr:hypothetical protein [Candidatus Fimivivens sp.]
MNFTFVQPAGFELPEGATLSLQAILDQGYDFNPDLQKYLVPKDFICGTAKGELRSTLYRGHEWKFEIFVEARNFEDLMRCYDAIRAELGGETVVIADPPTSLCEALTAIVAAPFGFVASIFEALIGSNKQ